MIHVQGGISRYCEKTMRNLKEQCMNHNPDIFLTSSDLVPAAVWEEVMVFCLGARRGGEWGPEGSSKLIYHVCVPALDPWFPTTNADCLSSSPSVLQVCWYVRC